MNTHSVIMSIFSCTAIVPFLGRGKRLWCFSDPDKCVDGSFIFLLCSLVRQKNGGRILFHTSGHLE